MAAVCARAAAGADRRIGALSCLPRNVKASLTAFPRANISRPGGDSEESRGISTGTTTVGCTSGPHLKTAKALGFDWLEMLGMWGGNHPGIPAFRNPSLRRSNCCRYFLAVSFSGTGARLRKLPTVTSG